MSALIIAVERGKSEIVSLLLFHFQTYVNLVDAKGDTATSIALKKGFLRSLKLLIRCPKTDIEYVLQKDIEYHGSNMKEVLEYQTELKKLPSTCCLKVEESLLKAAKIGDFRGVRGLLLCPDANINAVDEKGRTPLYLASWLSHANVVKVLINDKKN